MKENNSIGSVEKVGTDLIRELLDVEELESKIAPGGGSTSTIIVNT